MTSSPKEIPMRLFRPATPGQLDVGLALLRLVLGVIFAVHGGQKLFVYGFAGVTEGFGQMGVPFPGLVGPAIGLLEFFGGIALVLGFLTRVVGLGLAAEMVGAIVLVHAKAGVFLPGVEFVLALGGGAAALALTGAGRYSVDHAVATRQSGPRSAKRVDGHDHE